MREFKIFNKDINENVSQVYILCKIISNILLVLKIILTMSNWDVHLMIMVELYVNKTYFE